MRVPKVALLAVLALTIGAPPASGSVTLGQLGPNNTSSNAGGLDFIQQGVAAGTSYVVPANGTITSWSNNAPAAASQMLAMEIFRKTRDPNFFTLIGHDGPHPLTSGLVNTFQTSVPVQAGDLLGLNCTTNSAACTCGTSGNVCTPAVGPGDTVFNHPPPPVLQDGNEVSFNGPFGGLRLNITAVFVPSNTVTIGTTTLNKKKGTATLNLTLPNPGDLTASGNGVTAASAGRAEISKAVGAGPAQLLIKAKGKKRKTLNATGKVKLTVTITYTPTNGSPGTQTVKVKLRRKI